jgi:ADP-ribosylglycohydrolase
VDQDRLAATFADRCEPCRGYGAGAFTIPRKTRQGTPWKEAASSAFDGQGSCGNGAAMRIAPLGAYFADSPETVTAQAIRASEVTHQHPEGIAGGVAVAHASAIAAKARMTGRPRTSSATAPASRRRTPSRSRSGTPPPQWVAEREPLPDRVSR